MKFLCFLVLILVQLCSYKGHEGLKIVIFIHLSDEIFSIQMQKIHFQFKCSGFLHYRLQGTLVEKVSLLHRTGKLKESEAKEIGLQIRKRLV